MLAGLDGSVEISELCRREGINPTQYDGWKKQLVGAAAKVFAEGRASKPSAQQQRLESDLRRAKDVIAEITAENLDLLRSALLLDEVNQLIFAVGYRLSARKNACQLLAESR